MKAAAARISSNKGSEFVGFDSGTALHLCSKFWRNARLSYRGQSGGPRINLFGAATARVQLAAPACAN
jgi:hypothetical protein